MQRPCRAMLHIDVKIMGKELGLKITPVLSPRLSFPELRWKGRGERVCLSLASPTKE